MTTELHPDSHKIDLLGGTNAVARLCKVRSPSVSKWRQKGIPMARKMFLELIRPDIFGPSERQAASGEVSALSQSTQSQKE
ncbi:hypothetical protein CTI14_22170 [Methylobacterium radiotolerans]|nr:hypothetical protein CTI14_22170 [Methylobacterium radiotolerans]